MNSPRPNRCSDKWSGWLEAILLLALSPKVFWHLGAEQARVTYRLSFVSNLIWSPSWKRHRQQQRIPGPCLHNHFSQEARRKLCQHRSLWRKLQWAQSLDNFPRGMSCRFFPGRPLCCTMNLLKCKILDLIIQSTCTGLRALSPKTPKVLILQDQSDIVTYYVDLFWSLLIFSDLFWSFASNSETLFHHSPAAFSFANSCHVRSRPRVDAWMDCCLESWVDQSAFGRRKQGNEWKWHVC